MQTIRYAKAPVSEAVIEAKPEFSDPASEVLQRFKTFADAQKPRFESEEHVQHVRFGLKRPTKAEPFVIRSDHGPAGFRLMSPTRALTIKLDAFAYSHLPPYSDWDTFSAEFMEYWADFVSVCRPQKVQRTAVRYINRIVVPVANLELKDFFNVHPQIPEKWPQGVAGTFLQLQLPLAELGPGGGAVVNFALDQSESNAQAPTFVLDLDVFQVADIEATPSAIKTVLERLRWMKNSLFEAAITDATRRLFQ